MIDSWKYSEVNIKPWGKLFKKVIPLTPEDTMIIVFRW
jgi:hypothetical protein